MHIAPVWKDKKKDQLGQKGWRKNMRDGGWGKRRDDEEEEGQAERKRTGLAGCDEEGATWWLRSRGDLVARDEKRMKEDEEGIDRRIKKDNWSKGGWQERRCGPAGERVSRAILENKRDEK